MSTPDQQSTPGRFESPPAIRSLMMLQATTAMVRGRKRPSFGTQVEVAVRPQGDDRWHLRLLASDTPEGIDAVVARSADIAIINPSALLTLAYRGRGGRQRPAPVRAITVLPQFDFLMFAVPGDSDVRFVEQLATARPALKISIRGNEPNHSVHAVMSDVLDAAGCPLADLESFGSEIFYDAGMASGPHRLGAVASGERTAIFDEAWPVWGRQALAQGMRFLSLRPETTAVLRSMGYRIMTITSEIAPGLAEPIEVVDFSGWPVFCHAEASDDLVQRFCAALDEQRDAIPWDGPGPLPLERMCGDQPDAPLDVPLHPAARAYWAAKGYC